jgi:hypothetical protein
VVLKLLPCCNKTATHRTKLKSSVKKTRANVTGVTFPSL